VIKLEGKTKMDQTVIIIHWRGPFHNANELPGGNGLYLLTGRLKGEKSQIFNISASPSVPFKNVLAGVITISARLRRIWGFG
jgi:hypothetical protein